MRSVVFVDALRTPIGKYGGVLKDVRPDDLAANTIAKLVSRNHLDASLIEDVLFGCANQAGEDNRNVARMAALLAGLPVTVPGATINRLCGSGLMAINEASLAIQSGCGDVYIAGGVESMTRAPLVMAKPAKAYLRGDTTIYDSTLGWRFPNPKLIDMYYPYSMGETAENVATRYSISRLAQDEFAVTSQQKYSRAGKEGLFAEEIIPVAQTAAATNSRTAESFFVDSDEHPRPNTTLDDLSKLKPAFRDGGTVTAGNSSGISDGAAALLIMSEELCSKLGYKPIARYVTSAVAGVDPAYMGLGPIAATAKVLSRASLSIEQMDLIELNEAFAAQTIACISEMHIDSKRLNVNGGAIALGHPLGCSGARIMSTLLHEFRRRKSRKALATMCIGVGQGISTLIEAV